MTELFKINSVENGGKKHYDINIGDLLANYMADDSVNKIDAQTFRGLDNTQDKDLKELLWRSDFKTERQKYGRLASLEGKMAVSLIRVQNKWVIKFFKPISWESLGRDIYSINVNADRREVVEYDNRNVVADLVYSFTILKSERVINGVKVKPGRVIRETVATYKESAVTNVVSFVVERETYVYPDYVTTIPVTIIRNNYNEMPDWMKAGDILKEINVFSNELGTEWEKTKTQFQNTAMFGKGKTGATLGDEIINGKWIHDAFSPNAKFASSLQAIISGSQTVSMLIQNIVFLEDRAMKYAFQGRDMDSSGTNKHNMQVGLFNQAHAEYNQVKKQQRENDYLYFFKEVVEKITKIKIPQKITIDSTVFEQGKIEGMKMAQAQSELYKSQAKAQKAQADKHEADAGKVEKETTQIGKENKQNNNENME